MSQSHSFFYFILLVFTVSCTPANQDITETEEGYWLSKDISLSVILNTPLSSNNNHRGDTFTTTLKSSFTQKGKTILPHTTKVNGLVKRVVRFEKLGDKAALLLLFDQIVLHDGRKIPFEASLDTESGNDSIKIKGGKSKDIGTIGSSAIAGSLIGGKTLGKDGSKKGLIVGAVAGAGAVLLSDMMEIQLPEGTELIIKLDESLFIPKTGQ